MKKLLLKTISAALALSLAASACGCSKGEGNDNTDSGGDNVMTDEITTGGGVSSPDNVNESLNYEQSDYSELFDNPTTEYRWNNLQHGMGEQFHEKGLTFFLGLIKDALRTGVGGATVNVKWDEHYLEDDTAFEDLNNAIKYYTGQGMRIWIYDEYGYPSGNAGGRVTLGHDEYVARGLVCTAHEGNGMTSVTVKKETHSDFIGIYRAYAIDQNGKVYNVSTNGKTATFKGTSGKWTFYVIQERYNSKDTTFEHSGYNYEKWKDQRPVNVMNAEATERFIELTYKKYADKLDAFDKVDAMFTDEPCLAEAYNKKTVFDYAQVSWVQGFEEEFEARHGYSIDNKLHMLFSGDSDEAKIVRVNYRQTVADLVSRNFFRKLSEFCEENGTKASGHLVCEEYIVRHPFFYGDLMQCLREQDIPGVDCLVGKLDSYLSESWPSYLAVKYVSSVATITDKDRTVMNEFSPIDYVYGDRYQISDVLIEQFRSVINMTFFNGSNQINSYFTLDSLGEQKTYYADMYARYAYLSRQLTWDSGVAVYYPINTQQAYSYPRYTDDLSDMPNGDLYSVGVTLFKNQLDYTFVDNQFLKEAKAENGKLCTENVTFTSVVLPYVEVMPLDVLQKLLDFEKSGGTLIWLGKVPALSDNLKDIEELRSLTADINTYEKLEGDAITKIKTAFNDKLKISKATSTLYVGRYLLNDAPLYWLCNNNSAVKELTLEYEGASGFDVYDPETGEITRIAGNTAKVNVSSFCSLFVAVLY